MELLAVIVIVALLSTLTVGTVQSVKAWQITSIAAQLNSAAHLARQAAVTSGKPVELRIYETDANGNAYASFRLIRIEDTATEKALSQMHRLPDGVVMRPSETASTILVSAPEGEDHRIIRYLPNGSIDLADNPDKWTVTIVAATAPILENDLPANYATVSFDPVLGTSAIFRP